MFSNAVFFLFVKIYMYISVFQLRVYKLLNHQNVKNSCFVFKINVKPIKY